jgi:predicted permease
VAAIVAAVAFGLAPAVQATRPNIVLASRGDFDTSFRPSRLRNALIVAQVTLSVVLLVSAGLLLSGSRHTERLDPGIRTNDVVQVELLARFRDRGLEVLRTDPHVRAIASSRSTALDGAFPHLKVAPDARPAEDVAFNVVSPAWFGVLGIALDRGRTFSDDEARARAPVAIVSRSTAARFWPGQDPIDRTVTIPNTDRSFSAMERYRTSRVIGVVSDVSPGSIAVDPSRPVVYYAQPVEANAQQYLARVDGAGEEARMRLERALAAVDSGAVVEIHTLASSLALQVYPFRAMYWLSSAIGAVALILTVIGVYGVMSYLVAQRRKEFGIRLALGAGANRIVALVLRQSMRLSVIGIALGVALTLAVSKVFANFLFNIDTFDVMGYVVGVGLVALSCVTAAYAPSRRAARVNPVETLRGE